MRSPSSDLTTGRPTPGCEPGAPARKTRPLNRKARVRAACSTGEPGAGNRHAGFGERGEETCPWDSDCGPVRKRRMSHRLPTGYAPPLDSTRNSCEYCTGYQVGSDRAAVRLHEPPGLGGSVSVMEKYWDSPVSRGGYGKNTSTLFIREVFRDWMIRLNRRGGVVLLDALDDAALAELVRSEAAAAVAGR